MTVRAATGRVVLAALTAAAWSVVVLPVWVLNRAFGIDTLARGAGWGPKGSRRRPGQPFGGDARPRGQAFRRALRALAMGAVVVVAAFGVGGRATTASGPRPTPFGPLAEKPPDEPAGGDRWARYEGVWVSRDTFPGEPWAASLLEYQGAAPQNGPDPRYGWRNNDLASRLVNVVDGRRVTLAADDPERTVWLFGGSTTYGIGQRDEHTIASQLVREAQRDGRSIEVVNFGVPGFVNWQETMVFADRLRSGDRPDVAVFVDGVNDLALGFEREVYGLLDTDDPLNLGATEQQQQVLASAARARGWVESHDQDRQARLTAEQYGRGVRRARALGREHGVAVVHFWQPQLTNMAPDDPGVASVLASLGGDPSTLAEGAQMVDRAASWSGVDPVDLTSVFEDAATPVFFDWAHTNEAGAAIEAAAIYRHIAPALAAGP